MHVCLNAKDYLNLLSSIDADIIDYLSVTYTIVASLYKNIVKLLFI